MPISPADIQRVKETANLRDVVAGYVQLKKQGRDWIGLCPFHSEKSPSFKVDPQGFFKCFGCGEGGDVITFLEKITGDGFQDAVKVLAEQFSVPLTNGRQRDAPMNIVKTYDYTDEDGAILFQVCRLDPKSFRQRRPDGNGGWTWGLGSARRVLYNLPAIVAASQVLLVEGEKDADNLIALGYPATCSPMGAGKWREEYTASLAGKQVVIFPDNDTPGRSHAADVAKSLLAAGNRVDICEIPPEVGKDISDWLASGKTMQDLRAESPRIPAVEWLAPAMTVSGAGPVASSSSNIRYMPLVGGEKTTAVNIQAQLLRNHALMQDKQGQDWAWNGQHWEKIPTQQLIAWALQYDSDTPKPRIQKEAVQLVQAATYAGFIPWRDIAPIEVPCANGVVNIETSDVRAHRQEDYLEAVVPHVYTPTAQSPRWLRFLDEVFGSDPDGEAKTLALQEFFGYCLLPHAKYKMALFLTGEPNSGKSRVTDALQDMVGLINTCCISTEDMADPRAREDIVGKYVNIVSELPVDAMVKDDGFKQLVSTGDAIAIDPKWTKRYTYIPFCKHVISTNDMPIINDQTRATVNRLLLIRFNRVFSLVEQDFGLRETLAREAPGILAWSVEGAYRLVQAGGKFTSVTDSTQLIAEHMADVNQVRVFLEERAVEDEEAELTISEITAKYCAWEGGRGMNNAWVGRRLRQARYTVGKNAAGAKVLLGYRWRV